MPRFLSTPLSILALLCALSFASAFQAHAQTAQPITSLPKPPGDTTVSTPVDNPPAQNVPANTVHPITSLPKPPAPVTPAGGVDTPASIMAAPAASPEIPAASPETVAAPPALVSSPSQAMPPPAQPAPDLEPVPLRASVAPAEPSRVVVVRPRPMRAFSTAAIAVKVGFAGVGADVATPLATHFNLRVGGSFFSYSGSFNTDGITINGDLKFRSGTASLDWFPSHGGFHISPGVTFYNGNNLNATVLVPGGQTFSLGDANYVSSNTDPVHGTASVYFGRHVAPSLTVGFGNMIPRSGRHISFPFEIGFQYIGPPGLTFNLVGTACTNANDPITCSPIQTDAQTQANIQQQESKIDSDVRPLRFYPIISQGFSVRF